MGSLTAGPNGFLATRPLTRLLPTVVLLFAFAAGCKPKVEPVLRVETIGLADAQSCSGRFAAHDLPHVMAENVERVGFFLSNGSGLAINDLDNDGDLDLVLGNLFGPNQIFWNEGSWQFRPETLFEGSARAVTTVDLDGDGWLDIVLAKRNGDVWHWRNRGVEEPGTPGRFVRERLDGVQAAAYSMNWSDLDLDGDLDLVTASYDASLEKQSGDLFKQTGRAGIFVYQNQDGRFTPTRLSENAQALSLILADVNQDGRSDILVGNDFDVRDETWLAGDEGWTRAEPFETTTFSTMSMDTGDINNDGRMEFFAADMHPYSGDRDVMLQWLPVMAAMEHTLPSGDPQHMANTLHALDDEGEYENRIYSTRTASQGFVSNSNQIAATGWSWSSKFGDLDQDGFLDLYVVNGMKALDNFSYLPNDELVEENQAFRNDGQGTFEPQIDWGLNSRYGGRGMSMADLDGDGDLDIVINNLQGPAQIFENQLCQGSSLLVDLSWPASMNSRALDAELTLETSSGVFRRDVRALSGYISGDASRIHFGFPEGSELQSLTITWPDGQTSILRDLEDHRLLVIERG